MVSLTFWDSSNMINTAIISQTARALWTAVLYDVSRAKLRSGGFKNKFEHYTPMVVVQGMELYTDNTITDNRLSYGEGGLATLSRQARVL